MIPNVIFRRVAGRIVPMKIGAGVKFHDPSILTKRFKENQTVLKTEFKTQTALRVEQLWKKATAMIRGV
jgi:hypothetical protein